MSKTFAMGLGSLMLLSLTMTGCSSDYSLSAEELAAQERGVVKTQFTLALNNDTKGSTRMSEATVQGQSTPTFRGMQNIYLIPFKTSDNALVTKNDTRWGDNIVLPATNSVPAATADNSISSLVSNNNSQLYKDCEVPVQTNAFLFYGEAKDQAITTVQENKGLNSSFVNGEIVLDVNKLNQESPANYTFSLSPIISENVVDAKATALAEYLTAIAKADGWSTSTNVNLKQLYDSFITIKAGSSASIQAAVQALYTSVYSKSDAVSTAIKDKILFTEYGSSSNLTYATDAAGTGNTSTGTLAFTKYISGYPGNVFLPDGAAYVEWQTESSKFVVLQKDNMGLNITDLTKFTYPASLYYRGNSLIKTSNSSEAEHYAESSATWAAILGEYSTDNGSITQDTRSVALKEQIQYAVARLDVQVKAADATLYDNKSNSVTVGTENFLVTGIFIGGQNSVDWQFKPSASGNYTIYDKDIVDEMYLTSTAYSAKNHTLAFETVNSTAENRDAGIISIAVEFENKSGDCFYGHDGCLIYPNTKFYLVGKLKPYDNVGASTPINYAGTEEAISQALVQDYVTTAQMKVTSLGKAYNGLPDLRLPKLELGLSIDLSWKPGITQEVTLGE